MENLHIKFEYDEALTGKKEFLYSQLHMLELLKKLRDYRNSRKRELILKSRLKNELSAVKTKIIEIEEHLPKEAQEEIRTIRKIKHTERSENKSIESQLQEIKDKLSALQ